MTGIVLPTSRDPALSVIFVTYNAWEWSERALAALRDHTPPVYETIVVDNFSQDQTRQELARLEGARVVLNQSNVGFGAGANQGAVLARAPHLLFLNTDCLVEPGWLPPLLEVLDADADVAAVTPRLLHLDGRLQEAGSMVWGEGACDNYGDGDDPARPEYRFAREVDYASAACLVVRRSAFDDAGGYDDAYYPAYYEDNDLAMRWRSAGLRMVYEPRSTAVHRRWASSGDRSGMVDLLVRNRATFVERWRPQLAGRPPRPAEPPRADLTALRDAACGERLLVVAGRGGTEGLAAEVSTALARRSGWRVTLLAVDGGAATAAATALRTAGVEVVEADPAGTCTFLEERAGHHTAVLVTAGIPTAVAAAIAATQPSAAAIPLVAGDQPLPALPMGRPLAVLCAGPSADVEAERAWPSVPRVSWNDAAASTALLARVCGFAGR